MKKYIFYHIYCCNTTFDIVNDQMTKIIFSGLYDTIDTIYCFLSGEENYIKNISEYISKNGKKYKIAEIGINDRSYERFTIHKIKYYIQPEDKFLYIHSKGTTRTEPNTANNVKDWRTYMEYFVFRHYNKCLELLDEYDTVGVNLMPGQNLHYSGNFWWCRGSYFLALPDIKNLMNESEIKNETNDQQSKYRYTENYICMNNPNAYCLFMSNCPHYDARYFPENYVDDNLHRSKT